MYTMKKTYLLVTLAFFNISFVLGQSIINTLWPYIDSIPFPYPTPGPIDIPTSKAKPVFTPFPLLVVGSLIYISNATNTGSSLLVRVPPPPSAYGGILYGNPYGLFQREFLWDLDLKRSAGVKIDGYGPPLQVINTLYNMKYPSPKVAMTKRDGIAQIVNFVNVTSVFNPLFYPSQLMLPRLKKAGSSMIIPEFFNFIFLYTISTKHNYYCYPGMFKDHDTGKIYYSSTVIVPVRAPTPEISVDQFKSVFGSFLNEKGEPYSNILPTYPVGERPIGEAFGFILTVNPFK